MVTEKSPKLSSRSAKIPLSATGRDDTADCGGLNRPRVPCAAFPAVDSFQAGLWCPRRRAALVSAGSSFPRASPGHGRPAAAPGDAEGSSPTPQRSAGRRPGPGAPAPARPRPGSLTISVTIRSPGKVRRNSLS